ncbi:MAG: ABC transporter substrate-binding protein [Ancalomicrobiaceae bacterium]|nr:ABC transporter substrate-binding protein [Ancalomicrobiaceae bacterium]
MLAFLRSSGLAVALAGSLLAGAAPGPAAAVETVSFRYLANPGGVSPDELAAALGYYDGTGVALDSLGFVGGGPASLFALASGGVDIGSAATSAVINSIAGGNDFVAAYPSQGIGKEVFSTLYVLNDSPIHSLADLKGKTIAVNTLGAHLDYTIREAFHQAGLPENSATQIVVPGPQLEQTLRSKQVDVAAFGYWQATFAGVLETHGGVRAVLKDTDVLGEIAGGFVVLRRDFAKAHPEAVRAYVAGAKRAADWSREHLPEARKIVAKILEKRGENPEIAQFWTGFGLRTGADPVPRDIDFWVGVLERGGSLAPGKIKAANILYRPDSQASN